MKNLKNKLHGQVRDQVCWQVFDEVHRQAYWKFFRQVQRQVRGQVLTNIYNGLNDEKS